MSTLQRGAGDSFENSSAARGENLFLKAAESFLIGHPRAAFLLGLVLVCLIGLVDYGTGYDISLSFFYLLPILLITWVRERTAGILVAVQSFAVWFTAEALSRGPDFPVSIILWNAGIRLAFFLVTIYLLSGFKIRLQREQALASHDYLTGVVNARFFIEWTKKEMERAGRTHSVFTLGYFDVDDFKRVNDGEGHQAGDAVLQLIAGTISQAVRTIDVVARLGGDEFAVLMPLTDQDGARVVVQRIQKSLSEVMARHKRTITLSVGVVTCLRPPATVDEVISFADKHMYEAKKNGKNTVSYALCEGPGTLS